MKSFFNLLARCMAVRETANPLTEDKFEPPVSLPEGLKIEVVREHLTEKGKKNVGADNITTIQRLTFPSPVTPGQ